jgi:hypothetical protein
MNAMTRKERRIFLELVRLAGGPVLVEEALRETNREGREPTPLERIVQYIQAKKRPAPGATAS